MRIVVTAIRGAQSVADAIFEVNRGRSTSQVFRPQPPVDIQGDARLWNDSDCNFQDRMRNFVGFLVMGSQGPPLLPPNHVLTLNLRLPRATYYRFWFTTSPRRVLVETVSAANFFFAQAICADPWDEAALRSDFGIEFQNWGSVQGNPEFAIALRALNAIPEAALRLLRRHLPSLPIIRRTSGSPPLVHGLRPAAWYDPNTRTVSVFNDTNNTRSAETRFSASEIGNYEWILLHEIGHALALNVPGLQTQFNQRNGSITDLHLVFPVSERPGERFAEAFASYCVAPTLLQRVNPAVFGLLDQRFGRSPVETACAR
jgi:hypothetical protein